MQMKAGSVFRKASGLNLRMLTFTQSERFYSSVGQQNTPRMQQGDIFQVDRMFTAQDVKTYAALGGDSNPIHTSPEAAAAATLPGCLVHGMLYAGLFPALIGSHQPGAVYLKQTLQFRQPLLVGEKVRASVKVLKRSGRRAVLETTCHKLSDSNEVLELLLDGEALALLPNSE
mmetsp:Transcript_36393/g.50567  ORF Transcript_36393/g.50567 Transcript_36393/m.50567 type:complete len:173 (+) Transcript_36393:65-583(+)|eukprot:CAMPEP_0196575360 /NCGR_PEP_ID=MMETSP1081-20130531/4859_1 /TAXON_ID=36882 /ORGANISM="Pyramimonas amylifera, Strain CCMP720" /LENGTH=172 /DNA_ID=CAMNT_0041893637 /DNA_START=63 /DNA_END=581 /DNA_ORIENTATION=+